jgi:hypothetical protein
VLTTDPGEVIGVVENTPVPISCLISFRTLKTMDIAWL